MVNLPDSPIHLPHVIPPGSLLLAALAGELAVGPLRYLGHLRVLYADSIEYVFGVSSHSRGVDSRFLALVARCCVALYSGP